MLGLHLDLPDPWQIGGDLELLDANLVGADVGDNMVAAFQASQGVPATTSVAAPPDENALTDAIFNARHPERHGEPIQPGDKVLANEWIRIRNEVVRPSLMQAAGGARSDGGLTLIATGPLPALGRNAPIAASAKIKSQHIALGLVALALFGTGAAIYMR